MIRELIALAVVAAKATQALSITYPSENASIEASSGMTILWSSISTDPSTVDIVIVGTAGGQLTSETLATDVAVSDDKYTISSLNVPSGEGYQIDFDFDEADETGIIAQSEQFNVVNGGSSATTSSASSTSSMPSSVSTSSSLSKSSSSTSSASRSTASTDSSTVSHANSSTKGLKIGLGVGISVGVLILLVLVGICACRRKRQKKGRTKEAHQQQTQISELGPGYASHSGPAEVDGREVPAELPARSHPDSFHAELEAPGVPKVEKDIQEVQKLN